MAKKLPYEMLPHQYAEFLARKEPTFTRIEATRIVWNEKRRVLSAAAQLIQGKTPQVFKYGSDPEFEKAVKDKAQRIQHEHAKSVYLAQRAGIKVSNRILRSIPNLKSWAIVNNWDALPLDEIQLACHKNKKMAKPVPAREDPQDKFEELFSKENLNPW